MRITSLTLRQFRCFDNYKVNLDHFVNLIKGPNGIGKTSLLEALSYTLTARSFKAQSTQQVIKHGTDSCSIIGQLEGAGESEVITVLMSSEKKVVKLNQKPVKSLRELYKISPIVVLTEDDLELVKGPPLLRRNFIDQIANLIIPEYSQLMRQYKHVLDNRNALLYNAFKKQNLTQDLYFLWTDQLLKRANQIRKKRIQILESLEKYTEQLCKSIAYPFTLEFKYEHSYPNSFDCTQAEEFLKAEASLLELEKRQKRSLFGAHLDDFSLLINKNNARIYASRGQQKFILFLLKLAQAQYVTDTLGLKPIFLLDDIITDFDKDSLFNILSLILKLSSQLIITSPSCNPVLEQFLSSKLEKDSFGVTQLTP